MLQHKLMAFFKFSSFVKAIKKRRVTKEGEVKGRFVKLGFVYIVR